MTTYNHLDWKSLNTIKNHLYRRLASPISNALGRLAIARHLDTASETEAQLIYAERNLERAMNLLRAWAALIHVKSGGAIAPEQRRRIPADEWPEWVIAYLHTQTGLKLDHTTAVYVHPETFFESILLLWRTGAAIGALKHITTQNAKDEEKSIWVRAIFEPPPTGFYTTLDKLADHLNAQLQYDTLIQLMVLQDLFAINGATLKIQNNKQTGEQALAACLPAVPMGLPVPDAEESNDLFTTEIEQASTPDDSSEHESFFAQVIRDLNSEAGELGPIIPEGDRQTESGESETLMVPPPTLRERLAAISQNHDDALHEHAAGNHKPPDTLIVPPPGFRQRIEAMTRPRQEIEVVQPDENSETRIVPPPAIERRFNERRVKRDSQAARANAAESVDAAPDSSDPPRAGNDEDTPRESGEG